MKFQEPDLILVMPGLTMGAIAKGVRIYLMAVCMECAYTHAYCMIQRMLQHRA